MRYDAVNAMLLNEFLKEHRKKWQELKRRSRNKAGFQADCADSKSKLKRLLQAYRK